MSNKSKDVIISKKKPSYKVSNYLEDYLKNYNRIQEIPIEYNDLKRYVGSVKVIDNDDNDTLWQRVFFNDSERFEIEKNLKLVYNLLYSDGSNENIDFLVVDAIDYCTFGNSNPFRIKIRNKLNDNFTYYYVKVADSSRIYGLELEHITSPYNLNFIIYNDTLIRGCPQVALLSKGKFWIFQKTEMEYGEKTQLLYLVFAPLWALGAT